MSLRNNKFDPKPGATKSRSAQRERLYFVEFALIFLGQVSRRDLIGQFQISQAAATKDLTRYADLAPDMLSYDRRKKFYVYQHGTALFAHDVDRSLFSIAGERRIAEPGSYQNRLTASVQNSIKRHVPIELVSEITRCMYQKSSMHANYRSMSRGERERILTPTSLIHDGLRWHIRCFDHDKERFQDYNLARFISAKDHDESDVDRDNDMEWNLFVNLELGPHPAAEHPETIKLDYDIQNDFRTIPIRSCLVGYFLQYWPIDYTDGATDNPRKHPLRLMNKDELRKAGIAKWILGESLRHT